MPGPFRGVAVSMGHIFRRHRCNVLQAQTIEDLPIPFVDVSKAFLG